MTQPSSSLTIRRYGMAGKFVADPETAALLAGGVGVDFTAFTDPKYGTAGSRFIPSGTVVSIVNGYAVPYAAAVAIPTVTAYANTTAYTTGQFVRPTTPNGYAYQVTTAGTSAASEPTWPTTSGATVTSGGVTFTEAAVPGSTVTFAASHDYHIGQYVLPTVSNGHTYRVTKGGTTDTTEPVWPTTEGKTVRSGSVTFADVPSPAASDDTGKAYLMASGVSEPGGSYFLTSGQGTTGLYVSGVFFEDLLPDIDQGTHELPSGLKSALGPLFTLTRAFTFHEQGL